ncbi:hypothetical protein FRC08_003146 [Ceratobasidium sp. 394]|nr:hypothetical protein FRC08_003146 [Ceratobasidium sp. 394]
MSFRDEEELDWGEEEYRNPALDEGDADVVDTVSLGDEEEILQLGSVVEYAVEAPARSATPQTTRDPSLSPNKTRSGNSLSSQSPALGLSHLPPKPRTVVYGGRSRETIKAAAMSRPAPRSRSPPASASNDLPPNWEIRRSELTIYYYHTVLCASQLKKPTRDDARLDTKGSWQGEAPPPPGLYRSLSARNVPSSRSTWPENTVPGRYQKTQRTSSPPPRANSPPKRPSPPEDLQQGRAESRQQPPRPRSISPASMLIPRRGQSPARGLAKNGSDSASDARNESTGGNRSDGGRTEAVQKPRREAWDRRGGREHSPPPQRLDHYSPEPEPEEPPSRNGRVSRDTGALQAPRVAGSRRSRPYEPQEIRGMDHYSPPPEDDKPPMKHSMRRQSVSPPRQGGMRSDAMVFDQYASRRSGSPRPHGTNRNFDRPHAERTNFESRSRPDMGRTRSDADLSKGRDSARAARSERFGEHVSRHDGGEFVDSREDEFRGRDIRPSPRGHHTELDLPSRHLPGPMPPHVRDAEVFPHPDHEEVVYHNPPDIHPSRLERFHGRAGAPRPPRMGPVHPTQADLPMDSPRLSPHALRGDTPLPRHDPGFESHSGYPRNQRPPNAHHRRERSPPAHEHRLSPQEDDFIPANRGMVESRPPRHEFARPRDSNPRAHQQDDRTSKTWERGVEVPTPPPDQGRYDRRRQDNNVRKNWRGDEYSGRQHLSEEPSFEDDCAGPPPRYGRPISPDDKRSYPSEEREWTPRQPHAPLRMEMEVDPEPSPPARTEPLPGWADFRRRDHEEHIHERRGWGPKAWSGGEQVGPPTESDEETRKRRRVDDGTEVVSTFSRAERELPRKVPHHSPIQRGKPQSPVNSFNTLSNPAPPVSVPAPTTSVDFEAARARAKDVATQLTRGNPGSTRPRSRFGVMPAAAAAHATAPTMPVAVEALPKPDTDSAPSIKASETKSTKETIAVSAETHPDQKPRITTETGIDSPSHKSDDSSAPLVSRLGDASIGDSDRGDVSQNSGGRPLQRQDSRWKSNSYNSRNGGEHRGGRSRAGDYWRPENEDSPRDSPMRAWSKPNSSGHGGSQASSGFVPNAFIPRHAAERNFARGNQAVIPEGLPARPPPAEFPPMLNAGGLRRVPPSASRPQLSSSDLRARSPPPRDRELGRDADLHYPNADAQSANHTRPPPISFLSASNVGDTPRKNSLLNRMTEPGGGELSLMARLSSADRAVNDSQLQRQRRPKMNRPGPRR